MDKTAVYISFENFVTRSEIEQQLRLHGHHHTLRVSLVQGHLEPRIAHHIIPVVLPRRDRPPSVQYFFDRNSGAINIHRLHRVHVDHFQHLRNVIYERERLRVEQLQLRIRR